MRAAGLASVLLVFLMSSVCAFGAGTADNTPSSVHLGAGQYLVRFVHKAPAGTRSVNLAGGFNGWSPTASPMKGPDADGYFAVEIELSHGRYEYKFVEDGKSWVRDARNPQQAGTHGNSVIFVGCENQALTSEVLLSTSEVSMAMRADRPRELKDLADKLKGKGTSDSQALLERWIRGRFTPLVDEATVSFVTSSPGAEAVHVAIYGPGYWTAYELEQIGAGVFATTLKRDQLPDGSVYRFEVTEQGRVSSMVDSHAWSVTSRGGQPACVVGGSSDGKGRIELLADLHPSAKALLPREVYVFLPPGYDESSSRRYPVLYMHDGQNCWDDPIEPFGHGGWHVNVTAERLIASKEVEPFIVVGIPNTQNRSDEYGPGKEIKSSAEHAYIQYLLRDVKPAIDKRYRTNPTREHTFLMGSSMGGIISYQAAMLHPEVFGGAACLSPVFWFKDDSGSDYFDLLGHLGKRPVRIYIDSGTGGDGGDGSANTRKMLKAMLDAGWVAGEDFMHFEDAGAEHNERAWRARLEIPLRFLLGKQTLDQSAPPAS